MGIRRRTRKILIIVGVVVVLGGIIAASILSSRDNSVSVEAGRVERARNLVAMVSATGEIRPKEYVELQAEITGVINELLVREGDFVDQGSLLLKIDPIQTLAESRAQEALLEATRADARNQQAQIAVQRSNLQRDASAVRVTEAELESARQNLNLAEFNFERRQQLFEDNLISRDIYESAKTDLVNATSALTTAEMRLEQARAQYEVSRVVVEQSETSYEGALSRVRQQEELLARTRDLLSKTEIRSPLAGVITQMNVEVGERAVPGTLNNPAATLMIIANLSVIEAELRVDETDIVDLELGQQAVIKVDALPNSPLNGRVTEIGNSAIPTTSTQEAKDFKVVVQLEDPPKSLRPGLSCTGEITTAERADVLTIPIQALTIREFEVDKDGNLIRRDPAARRSEGSVEASPAEEKAEKKEFEGVFKIQDGKAVFLPVKTGIVGSTEIEVLSGLELGDEIVTGSYKTLRTIADGDRVQVDKSERG